MKFVGHTMGTPELDIYGSIDLFRELGYSGIEIRCAEDGHINSEKIADTDLSAIAQYASKNSIEISCLTPYFRDFVTQKRETELSNLRRVVEIAVLLDCRNIRLYGGTDPVPDGFDEGTTWKETVSGIRDFAANTDVRFCIETHIGSQTYSAEDAVRMVEEIDRDNVGILLDFAWVYLAGKENACEAVGLTFQYLFHCHYKDWILSNLEAAQPERKACMMGDGSIPWHELFHELIERGYDGTMSDEYERYWNPDILPPASEGMKHNLSYVRSLISDEK